MRTRGTENQKILWASNQDAPLQKTVPAKPTFCIMKGLRLLALALGIKSVLEIADGLRRIALFMSEFVLGSSVLCC